MRFFPALGCGLLALSLPLAAARAADAGLSASGANPWVIGSAGTFALVEEFGYPYLVGLQYRSTPRTSWALMPGVGLAGGPDGMGYFYADAAHAFALSRRWTMTLSLAAGWMDQEQTSTPGTVDDEALTQCVHAVAAAIRDAGIKATPAQYATLVELTYSNWRTTGRLDEPFVTKLMELMR